ncbi:MAG: AI-2E family transporter [Verrucomicrobia bacterium]|nr:AI-2E family transporter [Verrucomicrobiota bacterium]
MSSPKPSPTPTPAPGQTLRVEVAPKTLIAVVLVAAAAWVLLQLAPVLLVLVGALMIVGTLNPLVSGLERRKVRRGVAIAVVFGVGSALAGLGLSLTIPPLVAQGRAVIEHEAEIRDRVVGYLGASPLTRSLGDWVRDIQYPDLLKDARSTLVAASLRMVEIVAFVVAAVFLALYVMLDRDRLRGAVFALVPRNHHVRASRVLLNLETIVGGYIRGQVITCLLIGVFVFVLLALFRVPNALAIAVLGAAMDVLPYIGALLTIVPAVAAAFSVGPGAALAVLGLLLAYEQFESRLLVPLVYGRALRLPSSVVFFALLAGGALGGIVGALLALPLASAAVMLLNELRVDLPGEAERPEHLAMRQKDRQEEREYAARTQDAPAVVASAVAVEIARERKTEEDEAGKKS